MWWQLAGFGVFMFAVAIAMALPKPDRPPTFRYRLGAVLDSKPSAVIICSLALAGFVWLDSKFLNFIFDSLPYGWPSFAALAIILLITYAIAVWMDRRPPPYWE